MPSRIVEVRDAAATLVETEWAAEFGPLGANDEVIARYTVDIDSSKITGRKVYVFPSTIAGRPIARGDDEKDYTLAFLIVERFTADDGQGDPDEEWVDERVEFAEWLENLLGDPRRDRLLADIGDPNSGLWPEVSEVTTVCDLEELAERRLYVGVVTVTYREQVEA